MTITIFEGEKKQAVDNNKLGEYKVPLPECNTVEEASFKITLEMDKVMFFVYKIGLHN